MKSLFIHFRRLDWALIFSAVLICGIGLLSIYSSSLGQGGDRLNFEKQAIFLGIGFLLMLIFSFFDYRTLKENSYLILVLYFLSLLFLAGLLLINQPIRGVRGWYKLGPIAFSPMEFTKIILIILLAKYFSYRHTEMYRFHHIILSGFYVILPAFLIYLQPDLGSVLVLVLIWLGVLLVSGIRLRHFLILTLCAIVLFSLAWSFFLEDYQKQRIGARDRQKLPLGAEEF